MSTHNIGIYEDLTKIIFQLSSNTHLISSSVILVFSLELYPAQAYKGFHYTQYDFMPLSFINLLVVFYFVNHYA